MRWVVVLSLVLSTSIVHAERRYNGTISNLSSNCGNGSRYRFEMTGAMMLAKNVDAGQSITATVPAGTYTIRVFRGETQLERTDKLTITRDGWKVQSGCIHPTGGFKVGDAVEARWRDGIYYRAKVRKISAAGIEVVFDSDGVVQVTPIGQVRRR